MVKVVFRKGDLKKGLKVGLAVGSGSSLIVVGLITALLALTKGSSVEKETWAPIGLVIILFGWIMVRHATKSTREAISAILDAIIFNPFTWF